MKNISYYLREINYKETHLLFSLSSFFARSAPFNFHETNVVFESTLIILKVNKLYEL